MRVKDMLVYGMPILPDFTEHLAPARPRDQSRH